MSLYIVLCTKYTNKIWLNQDFAISPRGAGSTLIFSSYVDSGPASAVHPTKYQEFQAPQKYLKF